MAEAGIYYISSEEEGKEKRRILEEAGSVLINFVLFLWISKVILNFSVFIREPLTVLSYPDNAETF